MATDTSAILGPDATRIIIEPWPGQTAKREGRLSAEAELRPAAAERSPRSADGARLEAAAEATPARLAPSPVPLVGTPPDALAALLAAAIEVLGAKRAGAAFEAAAAMPGPAQPGSPRRMAGAPFPAARAERTGGGTITVLPASPATRPMEAGAELEAAALEPEAWGLRLHGVAPEARPEGGVDLVFDVELTGRTVLEIVAVTPHADGPAFALNILD